MFAFFKIFKSFFWLSVVLAICGIFYGGHITSIQKAKLNAPFVENTQIPNNQEQSQ